MPYSVIFLSFLAKIKRSTVSPFKRRWVKSYKRERMRRLSKLSKVHFTKERPRSDRIRVMESRIELVIWKRTQNREVRLERREMCSSWGTRFSLSESASVNRSLVNFVSFKMFGKSEATIGPKRITKVKSRRNQHS